MRRKGKWIKYKDESGRTYRFSNESLNIAWNIVDRVDKIDTASLYLRDYLKFDATDFTDDEWWLCCKALCHIYNEKMNSGARKMIWQSACDDFKELYEKGEVI